MCSRAQPRLHHSSDGGGGGGGGGGNNNSQAAATAAAASAADPSAAEKSPPPSRPQARPRPALPPPGEKKECLAPCAPRRGETPLPTHPNPPWPKVRFVYLFPAGEDVGAGAAGWLAGAFSVEAARGREGAGAGSAEGSDANGAAAQLYSVALAGAEMEVTFYVAEIGNK